MNIVAIDTSSKALDISFVNGEGVFLNISLLGKERTSKNLIMALKRLLEFSNLTISDIEGIVIVRGPGSFTGLKLGMTLGKIIAYFEKVPILGVDLFEIISFNYRYLMDNIEILIPSRKREFYYAKYVPHDGLGEYKVIREEEFSYILDVDSWIFAPTTETKEKLKEYGFSKIIPGWEFVSKAYMAAILGGEKIKSGQMDDPYTISPLYMRKFPF